MLSNDSKSSNLSHLGMQNRSRDKEKDKDKDKDLQLEKQYEKDPTVVVPLLKMTRSKEKEKEKENEAKEPKTKKLKDDSVKLFGVNLSHFPNYVQFTVLLCVVMLGFLLIGLVEEGFKHTFPDFQFGWFMTAIELVLFTVLAAIERILKETATMVSESLSPRAISSLPMNSSQASNVLSDNSSDNHSGTHMTKSNHDPTNSNGVVVVGVGISTANLDTTNKIAANTATIEGASASLISKVLARKVPLVYHIIVAAAMTASRGLTNISLLLLNYPTQVIFKSMKLISVMIGSKFFLHKEYNIFEYLAAPLMVGAAIAFSLGDASESLSFNTWGIVVVVVSLIFDSIHANAQEYTLKLHRDTALELLLYSNFFSGVFAALAGICAGELAPLFVFLATTSFLDILSWFTIRVLCLYVGVAALVVFTQRFGAVAAVTVTTVRKILTVLLSYVLWPSKSFAKPHAMGTLMFVGSLILNGAGVHYKGHS